MWIKEKQMQKNCRHCTMSKANQKNKIIQSTIKFQLMQMKCSSSKNLGHQANKWWQKGFSSLCIFSFLFIFCFSISFALMCSYRSDLMQGWNSQFFNIAHDIFLQIMITRWVFSSSIFCYCFSFLSLFLIQIWYIFHSTYITWHNCFCIIMTWMCCAVFILYLNRYMKSDENDEMEFCR